MLLHQHCGCASPRVMAAVVACITFAGLIVENPQICQSQKSDQNLYAKLTSCSNGQIFEGQLGRDCPPPLPPLYPGAKS